MTTDGFVLGTIVRCAGKQVEKNINLMMMDTSTPYRISTFHSFPI